MNNVCKSYFDFKTVCAKVDKNTFTKHNLITKDNICDGFALNKTSSNDYTPTEADTNLSTL